MDLSRLGNPDTIRPLFRPLEALPEFLLHPKRMFVRLFAGSAPFADALTCAAILFALSAAAYAAIGLSKGTEASSVIFLSIGTLVLWVGYAVFLHVFAFIFGARKGVSMTIAAYVYVMAFLQPVMVVLLWLLTLFVHGAVSFRTITGGFGGSGGVAAIASGRFFSEDVVSLYRLISGVLVLWYFTIGLVSAHQIAWWRAVAATVLSILFFIFIFTLLYFIDKGLGIGIVTRVLEG